MNRHIVGPVELAQDNAAGEVAMSRASHRRLASSTARRILVAVIGLMAASPLSPAVAAENAVLPQQITIATFAFAPAELTVASGTTVRWLNKDEAPHTIVTDDKAVRSGALDTGEHFDYRFTQPGRYSYHCSLHPQMTGIVIVR